MAANDDLYQFLDNDEEYNQWLLGEQNAQEERTVQEERDEQDRLNLYGPLGPSGVILHEYPRPMDLMVGEGDELFEATLEGDLKKVKRIINNSQNKENINNNNNNNNTKIDLNKLYMRENIYGTIRSDDPASTLMNAAIYSRNIELVEYLISKGAKLDKDINDGDYSDKYFLLIENMKSSLENTINMAKYLQSQGAVKDYTNFINLIFEGLFENLFKQVGPAGGSKRDQYGNTIQSQGEFDASFEIKKLIVKVGGKISPRVLILALDTLNINLVIMIAAGVDNYRLVIKDWKLQQPSNSDAIKRFYNILRVSKIEGNNTPTYNLKMQNIIAVRNNNVSVPSYYPQLLLSLRNKKITEKYGEEEKPILKKKMRIDIWNMK